MAKQRIFAHTAPGLVPSISRLPVKAAEAWNPGAALVVDANGELTECADDPASIKGFALKSPATGPGFDAANSPTVITGREDTCEFVPAKDHIFIGRGVNGGTDPVTPTATMVGEQYELAGNGDDWYINIAGTASPCVQITRVDIDNKLFFFRVLDANIQL